MILGIYGAGDSGKELVDIILSQQELCKRWERAVFIDDGKAGTRFYGLECLSLYDFADRYGAYEKEAVVAVGEPFVRELLAQKLHDIGIRLATVIHPDAFISPTAKIGKGVVIRSHTTVSSEAVIGDNVWIQGYCVIGHDVVIGDNSQISTFVTIGGHTVIGRNVYIGMQSGIREALNIGDNSIISLGAMVLRDVPTDRIAIGNPANSVIPNKTHRVFDKNKKNELTSDATDCVCAKSVESILRELCPDIGDRKTGFITDGLFDSLLIMDLIDKLESTFEIHIPVDELSSEQFDSVDSLNKLINKLKDEKL